MILIHTAVLVDDVRLTAEDMLVSCAVDVAWLLEHVQSGVLLPATGDDIDSWRFSGDAMKRARRLRELEHQFDAGPELAGLVADILDELDRIKCRLRRAGLSSE